jgi:two-component system, chemotaxis family, sensor kinase CheA
LIDQYSNETMLDMYVYETAQNLEQLERCILESEESSGYKKETINEIFRAMHTIKGSSAMMLYNNISELAHAMEDLFYFIREHNPQVIDYTVLSNLILDGVDFIKVELHKIKSEEPVDGDASGLRQSIINFLKLVQEKNPVTEEMPIQQVDGNKKSHYYIAPNKTDTHTEFHYFKATVYFDDGCEMENIRAFAIIHNIKDIANEVYYHPADIIENDDSIQIIREEGFKIYVKADRSYSELRDFFHQTLFLKDLELAQLANKEEFQSYAQTSQINMKDEPVKKPSLQTLDNKQEKEMSISSVSQSMISVNVTKLDKLMDLVGELVISESMVLQNPDLKGLELNDFQKAARQLHKIIYELQDTIMSIRMVPLSNTFHKMQRIVRDMSKRLEKEVQLEIVGEGTEVDKNIIEHVADPLMHLVRNAIDHGIETTQERVAMGKPKTGKVYLEAKNAGSDVIILVKDDGRGLNKKKILKRARENNLLGKAEEEMTDKEIYNLILLPGFSTKEDITEFSGRGVGMDVVTKNIDLVGGTVSIDSEEGVGSTFKLKIPLTLAIIDGMNIQVGNSYYTIPITAIQESFRPKKEDIIRDHNDNEMIIMRGECYSIIRMHKLFHIKTEITDLTEGIIIMIKQDDKRACIFADKLLGQQQVVVKSLPKYIRSSYKNKGLAGCTLLGDGNISLILDIAGVLNNSN